MITISSQELASATDYHVARAAPNEAEGQAKSEICGLRRTDFDAEQPGIPAAPSPTSSTTAQNTQSLTFAT